MDRLRYVVKCPLFLSSLLVGATICTTAVCQEDKRKLALKMITDTATDICQSAPLESTASGVNLTGDATAKVNGLVGKVADLGVSGHGKYYSDQTKGLLQKDLITAIQSGNECKLEVFRTLQKSLVSPQDFADDQLDEQTDKSKYALDNPEAFCKRLKKTVTFSKTGFKDILPPGTTFSETTTSLKAELPLPSTVWCTVNQIAQMGGAKPLTYYSCELFQNETDKSYAYVKFDAYIRAISQCMGADWVHDAPHRRPSSHGRATTFSSDSGSDPTLELQTSASADGIDLVLNVNAP